MNDFQTGIRKTFDGTDEMTYTLTLPGVQRDIPEINFVEGIMTLPA